MIGSSEPVEIATAVVLDTATGRRLGRLRPFGRRVLPFDSAFVLVPRFVDEHRIAFLLANDTPAEASLAVWSLHERRSLAVGRLDRPEVPDFEARMAASPGEALAILPDGTIAAGNLDAHLYLFAGAIQPRPTSADIITAVAVAPDGSWVAAAGETGPLVVLALPGASEIATAPAPEGCGTLAVSPDGRRLAAGCEQAIRIYDVAALVGPRGRVRGESS